MRARIAAATLLVFLVAAAPAVAGDPILPLSQVHAGMRCTGYSVVRGTDVSSFDVEVIDVVSGDPSESGARILVRVSGPAVDATGVGPGFSGSPIYCDPGDGTPRSIGAISESIGDYGGKVVLATPIESILATPVDGPAAKPVRGAPAKPARDAGALARARERALLARARPLAAPLMVTGVSPRLGAMLSAAGRRAGRVVLSAPAGPLATLRAAAAAPGLGRQRRALQRRPRGRRDRDGRLRGRQQRLGVRPSHGRLRAALAAAAGRLRVQRHRQPDLAARGRRGRTSSPRRGTTSGRSPTTGSRRSSGRVGGLPRMTPVRVYATDEDTGTTRTSTTQVADEAPVGQPGGTSALSFIGPTAIAQAAGTIFDGSPARLTGTMCARIVLRERAKPLRFCNRYVTGEPDAVGRRQRDRRPGRQRRPDRARDDRLLQGLRPRGPRGLRAREAAARDAPGVHALDLACRAASARASACARGCRCRSCTARS